MNIVFDRHPTAVWHWFRLYVEMAIGVKAGLVDFRGNTKTLDY